jgi:hypothetical protein
MTRSIAVLVVLLLASLAAPAAGQSPSAAPPQAPHLDELMRYVIPEVTTAGFTDWSAIRRSQGTQDLTGASPLDAKLPTLMATSTSEAAASGFALQHMRTHHDEWGWDAFDLDWEATLSLDGPPLFVLRFREGTDLARIQALFDERGFTTEALDGAVLRSREMDLSQDWLRGTEFAILNTAFLDDGRTLVLSASDEGVRKVVDWLADPGALPPVWNAPADALAGASAAFLLFGPGTCGGFMPLPMPGQSLEEIRRQLEELMAGDPLGTFWAMGVGYGDTFPARGRIAFGYLTADEATADLPARRRLAEEGISLVTGQPYAETVFAVEDATTRDATLLLEVAPADDIPRRLFQMIFARDMLFASCSGEA